MGEHLSIWHLLQLPSALLLSLPALIAAQEACVLQHPLTYGVIHEQAVSINTNVLLNTTFHPLSEVAATISDAPTSLDGITTFTWTETKTYMDYPRLLSSASVTAAQTTPTPMDSSFVMIVRGQDLHQKRQSGSYYVSASGVISNDCTNSPIYTINNGGLTATVNGVIYTYSTSSGVPYAAFAPSTVPGTITTTFGTGANQVLVWRNAEFFNGQAAFCALANGMVYAVFQENAQPDGCLYIQLSLFSVSSCQGLQLSTITGPPGPTDKSIIVFASCILLTVRTPSRKSRTPRGHRATGKYRASRRPWITGQYWSARGDGAIR